MTLMGKLTLTFPFPLPATWLPQFSLLPDSPISLTSFQYLSHFSSSLPPNTLKEGTVWSLSPPFRGDHPTQWTPPCHLLPSLRKKTLPLFLKSSVCHTLNLNPSPHSSEVVLTRWMCFEEWILSTFHIFKPYKKWNLVFFCNLLSVF